METKDDEDAKALELFEAQGKELLDLFRKIIKRADTRSSEEDRAVFISGMVHGIDEEYDLFLTPPPDSAELPEKVTLISTGDE